MDACASRSHGTLFATRVSGWSLPSALCRAWQECRRYMAGIRSQAQSRKPTEYPCRATLLEDEPQPLLAFGRGELEAPALGRRCPTSLGIGPMFDAQAGARGQGRLIPHEVCRARRATSSGQTILEATDNLKCTFTGATIYTSQIT